MAMLIPEVVKFAAGNTDFYEAAYDNYFNLSGTPPSTQNLEIIATVMMR